MKPVKYIEGTLKDDLHNTLPSNGLWGAWCRKCKVMRSFGQVYRDIGWPFCQCGEPFEWVVPVKEDGILRVWDEAVLADKVDTKRLTG